MGKGLTGKTLVLGILCAIAGTTGFLSIPYIRNAPALASKEEDPFLAYARYTAEFEGRRKRVYDPNPNDRKEEPTIGVGHFMGRPDSRETFRKVLPEVNYDEILAGRQTLTNEQIDSLFAHDLQRYVETARRLFPRFDSYPLYLRQALVDGCYRGDLLDSPKTRALANQGRWYEASREYVNRKDYERDGMPGVKRRIESNCMAMQRYSENRK